MKNASDCYTLSNGVRIPCIGLGTWQTDGATKIGRASCRERV